MTVDFATEAATSQRSRWPYLVMSMPNTLPPMAMGARGGEFVGRERELCLLDSALEGRAECPGLFVAGEAGIGKTRLLREFAGRAESTGVTVTWGGCLESGAEDLPFAPFVEALGRLYEKLGEDDVFTDPDRADLAAFIPALGPRPAHKPERIRLFDAVRGLFDRLPYPTLLVIEDIHWADRSSLELLSYLVRRMRHGRTLLAATFRSDEVLVDHPAGPVIAELLRTGRAKRLDLAALTSADLGRIVQAIQPAMPPAAVATIAARAEGNAFFAEALASGPWTNRDELPATLRDLLLLRVDQVRTGARDVLDLVATAGRPVRLALLETVWDGSPQALDRGLAEATARGLLVEDESHRHVGLRHALVGDAIEARMQPRQRAKLHERLAILLAGCHDLAAPTEAGRTAELARHWLGAGRNRESLAASIAAAGAAELVPARAEAHAHYEHSLELWGAVADAEAVASIDHTALLCRAARAAFLAGDAARAAALEGQAGAACQAVGDSTRAGEHYATLADYRMRTSGFAEGEAAAERALSLVPQDRPSRERALALWALALARQNVGGRHHEAVALASQAAEVAHVVSADDLEARARSSAACSLWQLGHDESAQAELDQAVVLAEASNDPRTVEGAYLNRLSVIVRSTSDPPEAWRALGHVRDVAERLDIHGAWGELAVDEAVLCYRMGSWDELEARATSAIDAMMQTIDATIAAGDEDNLFEILRTRGRARLLRGQIAEGEADLRATLAEHARSVDVSDTHMGLATAAITRGLPELALEEIELAFRAVESSEMPVDITHVCAYGLRAAADLAELGHARREPAMVTRAEELGSKYRACLQAGLAGTLVPGMGLGRAIRAACVWGLAEASRLADQSDPTLWADAVDWLRQSRYPDLVAYAQWRLAEAVLLAHGDRDEAATCLRAANEGAAELGMRPLLDAIEALAQRARIDLHKAVLQGATQTQKARDPYGLSAREREVLALLVDGRTNREIGQVLFISDKTASAHVTHILDKLGVGSRGAAAALAARAGLTRTASPRD